MYSCLELLPVPGDPFSAFVPSFAFGLVCLSSLESLRTHTEKFFPKGMCRRWGVELIALLLCFLWLVFSFLYTVSYTNPRKRWCCHSYSFGGLVKHAYGKAANLKAWMTTVPNKMNKAEKMRDRSGIISRLQIITDTLYLHLNSVLVMWKEGCLQIKYYCSAILNFQKPSSLTANSYIYVELLNWIQNETSVRDLKISTHQLLCRISSMTSER